MADFLQILSLGAFFVIGGILFLAAVYGVVTFFSKRKIENAYADKYRQYVQVTKMNCPREIYEKELIKVSDKNFSGIRLGYIYGKNFKQIDKKWYHIFVVCLKKRRLYDPFSWVAIDQLAVASADKISIGDGFNIKWKVGGLDAEGFYVFEAEGDLTPTKISKETANMVGLKQVNIMLRDLSRKIDLATEVNPNIKGTQKVTTDLPARER